MPEHISPDEIEILDPEPEHRRHFKAQVSWQRKYGPYIFWGSMVAIPAMNMTASYFNYRTAKIELELEKLRDAAQVAA